MLRVLCGSIVVLALCAVTGLSADEKDKGAKDAKKANQQKATITNMDPKKGTITVKMKNKEGKEVERTFELTEDVRYFDSTGKAAVIDVFQSGNEVLILEAEGKLKEMQKQEPGKSGEKKPAKPGGQ